MYVGESAAEYVMNSYTCALAELYPTDVIQPFHMNLHAQHIVCWHVCV